MDSPSDPNEPLRGEADAIASLPAPREIELKLFVPPSSVARLWSHPLLVELAVGPLRVSRIDNRYFDTPERELAERRMALRLRRIARRWMQTLKVAGVDERALSTRGEWEMPVAGAALELAKLRGTPLFGIDTQRALAARLKPVFTTNFRREARVLRLKDGGTVEFAFDVGSIVAGRGRARRSAPIREVEIEVKQSATSGAAPDLLKLAARLARDLALIPLAASKAERGFRVADGVPLAAVKVRLPLPHPGDRPRAHLARVLEACNGALLANTHALFEFASTSHDHATADADIEYVHQARVAVRRMRSALRTFRPVARGSRVDALDATLRSIGTLFGHARDWDVFATETIARIDDEVAGDVDGRAALEALRGVFRERRIDAHRTLLAALEAAPFGAGTIAIERMVERLDRDDEGGHDHRIALDDCVPAWLSAQRDRIVERSRRIAILDQQERHGLRIEVKRLRYALDLFGALYDDKAVGRFRDALSELQDRLGRLNDAVVADALMQSLPPTEAVVLLRGRLAAWLHRHVPKQLPKIAALAVACELVPQPWLPAAKATS